VVEAVCAILLIGVILLQKARGEGLGMAFGAGMGETLFGSRAGNVLTRITITLGITFLVTTTLLAVITTSSHEKSLIDERVADVPMAPPQAAPAPAAPTAPAEPFGAPAPAMAPMPLTSTEAPAAPAQEQAMAPSVAPEGETAPAETVSEPVEAAAPAEAAP
jgi:preprotein translocase subunit SecG